MFLPCFIAAHCYRCRHQYKLSPPFDGQDPEISYRISLWSVVGLFQLVCLSYMMLSYAHMSHLQHRQAFLDAKKHSFCLHQLRPELLYLSDCLLLILYLSDCLLLIISIWHWTVQMTPASWHPWLNIVPRLKNLGFFLFPLKIRTCRMWLLYLCDMHVSLYKYTSINFSYHSSMKCR